jgi:uncharacterized cupredoxin-like copper-binding protein
MRGIRWPMVAIGVLLLSAAGCGDDDDDEGADVDVVVSEFIVDPSEDSVEAGEVTFAIDNQGSETHEFLVVEAASADDLPVDDDGAFDEEADGVVDEVEDIEAGDTAELTLDLEAGDYVLLCNVVEDEDGEAESHFAEGMHADFTVE